MKKIKKISLIIITVLSIMLLVACTKDNKKETKVETQPTTQQTEASESESTETNIGESETAVYELNKPGITGKVTIEYDGNNVVKRSISETVINYVEAGIEKAETEETTKTQAKTYENMKGADHKIDYTDEGLDEVLVLNYEKLSEDVKNTLFATVIDENGNIMADKLGQGFEELGYVKK